MVIFRLATENDVPAISEIYEEIHTEEERGNLTIGWERGVYPVYDTAMAAVQRQDMYVCEEEGRIIASAIINQIQVDSYAKGNWEYEARDDQVLVLHTLSVSPSLARKGIGTKFVHFYEACAKGKNCNFLRMDTNVRNVVARKLYNKLNYKEADIVPCSFNGIPGIDLVLLEKKI